MMCGFIKKKRRIGMICLVPGISKQWRRTGQFQLLVETIFFS